jgi:hypothetical protein
MTSTLEHNDGAAVAARVERRWTIMSAGIVGLLIGMAIFDVVPCQVDFCDGRASGDPRRSRSIAHGQIRQRRAQQSCLTRKHT